MDKLAADYRRNRLSHQAKFKPPNRCDGVAGAESAMPQIARLLGHRGLCPSHPTYGRYMSNRTDLPCGAKSTSRLQAGTRIVSPRRNAYEPLSDVIVTAFSIEARM